MVRAFLYDAEGRDREVRAGPAMLDKASDQQLLWFDVCRDDAEELAATLRLIGIEGEAAAALGADRPTSQLWNYGGHFQVSVPEPPGGGRRTRNRLDLLVSETWLLTVRDADIQFLRDFREQDRGETMKGALTPSVLAASLLDWHLESYFDALAKVEAELDALDGKVLAARTSKGVLGSLATMRRTVAVLRASVAEQRAVFHGLVRPDFSPVAMSSECAASYQRLSVRFDRVMDSVERARDGIVGSFDLFASKTGQETNELVKTLTFATVVTGIFAAVAGVFGMNFKAPLFDTGPTGFYSVVGGLLALVVVMTIIARRRGWI